MAGIYIHIPFCRRACHYCDFHFSTNIRQMEALVKALMGEVELRSHYLGSEPIQTIYFGGGTPSLLPSTSIGELLNSIQDHFNVSASAEITLEANPEDLSPQKLRELKALGINRLSLGTQSFIAEELVWMNRMHTPTQAIDSIREAQSVGFDNISIDLIFGLPEQTLQQWELNLNTALGLDIQHISSYGLTVEGKTKLHHSIRKGTQKPPEESIAEACFRMNMEVFPANGFEHYEISNFAKDGFISKHNSAYWQNANYLGLGPSAHSFNGTQRHWNVRSNAGYTRGIASSNAAVESEELTLHNRINEHIMTGLRCKWGINREYLQGIDAQAWERIAVAIPKLGSHYFEMDNDRVTLSNEGKLLADKLASELFV